MRTLAYRRRGAVELAIAAEEAARSGAAVFVAAVVSQLATVRGLRRINIAAIVRERSL